MSPRRRIDPDSPPLLAMPAERRSRGLPLITAVTALVVVAGIAAGALVLINHEQTRRAQVREVAVLSFVRSFIMQYMSLDPFHANDYADKVLAQGTGEFAKLYTEKMNAIVIQVARAEPSKGSVQDLGVQRWNDDGSANVVVAATSATKMPDGKVVEAGNRWLVTATKEGEQWKISSLVQVI